MAQLPGQRAQPQAAGAQGALGHRSDIGSGQCCVILVGPFQLGIYYESIRSCRLNELLRYFLSVLFLNSQGKNTAEALLRDFCRHPNSPAARPR